MKIPRGTLGEKCRDRAFFDPMFWLVNDRKEEKQQNGRTTLLICKDRLTMRVQQKVVSLSLVKTDWKANLTSTNSELRRTTAKVSEQNIVQAHQGSFDAFAAVVTLLNDALVCVQDFKAQYDNALVLQNEPRPRCK